MYESSLSALIQQYRIENKTVNAPAILSISPMNAGIISLCFSLIVSGLFVWFVSILWIIDINGFNFSMLLSVFKIKKC